MQSTHGPEKTESAVFWKAERHLWFTHSNNIGTPDQQARSLFYLCHQTAESVLDLHVLSRLVYLPLKCLSGPCTRPSKSQM